MQLRGYQEEAVQVMLDRSTVPEKDILCLATAAGKSHIIAEFVKRHGKRCLVLCDTPEILVQNREKMRALVDPEFIGTYSAKLKEKTIRPITFAMVQSVVRNFGLFKDFDTVVIDECHKVPYMDQKSRYRTVLKVLPDAKVYGLTATPYRLSDSTLYERVQGGVKVTKITILDVLTRKGIFWNKIVFNIDAQTLVDQHYTVPLLYLREQSVSRSILRLSGSDFDTVYAAQKFQQFESAFHSRMEELENTYKSILIFCSTVDQAQRLCENTAGSALIHAETPQQEREEVIAAFKERRLKTLFNVSCLTTGFDAPCLECIVMIRPTRSLSLYQQMLGRGVRLYPDKHYCAVYDFSGNVNEFGPMEQITVNQTEAGIDVQSAYKSGYHGMVMSSYTKK